MSEKPAHILRQLLFVCSAVFLCVFLQRGELDGGVRNVVFWLSQPGQRLAEGIIDGTRWGREAVIFVQQGTEQLARLEFERSALQAERELLQSLQKENELLRTELGQREERSISTFRLSGAESAWFIDGGCNDGVQEGVPVIFSDALVGVVKQAYPHYSQVQTLLHEEWRQPVSIGTGSARGLLVTAEGYPRIEEVKREEESLLDAGVKTVALESLPAGIPIGKITDDSLLSIEPYFWPEEVDFVQVRVSEEETCSG